ncbi:MAG: hypothetical protein KDD84_18445 [Caldilineaceae bacterium]|nr:hypothetical protein [Caldilineaceae bacterium]
MKAFIVMGRSLKAIYDELFLWVWLSALWWLGTVLVVTAAPATLGLNMAANRVANYKRVDSSFFWESARQHIGKGWLLYVLHILFYAGVVMNIVFYLNSAASWMQIIGIVFIWILILLMMSSQYFFALFWQQDEPSLRMVFRNAVLLALRYPVYTFLMLIFQILLLVISFVTVLPILLLMPAAIAVSANFALVGALQEMDLAPQPPQVDARR